LEKFKVFNIGMIHFKINSKQNNKKKIK